MEYKLLEEQDLGLMLDFVDDENTKYNVDVLKKFIQKTTTRPTVRYLWAASTAPSRTPMPR